MKRLALLALAAACSPRVPPAAPIDKVPQVDQSAPGEQVGPANAAIKTPAKKKKKDDPLFPKRPEKTWADLDAAALTSASEIADVYVRFLTAGKTPRRAVSALIAMAEEAGGRAAERDERGLRGFHYFAEKGGDATVFFRSGTEPVSSGVSVIVASVDAPRLVLKENPVSRRYDFEVLETAPHGELDLRSWMVHPMALDIFAAKGGKPVAFSIGESEADAVFSIPDLLPHLSRRSEEVDAERLNVLSAAATNALDGALRSRGLELADLAAAETSLVPAAEAARVGVDRAMIGGYGQARRSLAFAAMRALIEATPQKAAVLIIIGRSEAGDVGTSGVGYVGRAIRKSIQAMSENELDVYATQLALSRTTALVASAALGTRGNGVVIDLNSADAMPGVARSLTAALSAAGVPFDVKDNGSEGLGRAVGSLDVDSIGLAIPSKGNGTPGETLSVLDLYHGVLACRVWLSRSL